MDVDKLRAELEKQLGKNPHEDAPGGFRDRFETVAEEYAANDGDFPPEVLEGQLQQIRKEAEAAAKAAVAEAGAGGDQAAEPESAGEASPTAPAPSAPGFAQNYGIALVAAVAVLVAGFFYFR